MESITKLNEYLRDRKITYNQWRDATSAELGHNSSIRTLKNVLQSRGVSFKKNATKSDLTHLYVVEFHNKHVSREENQRYKKYVKSRDEKKKIFERRRIQERNENGQNDFFLFSWRNKLDKDGYH